MKLSHLVIVGAAAVSFSAIAADEQKQQSRQPQAQSSQSESASGGASASSQSQRGQQHMSQQSVRQLQQQLKAEGHDIQVDGIMGPKTQAALKDYQQSKGLPATGQPDQQTLSELGISESGASVGGTAGEKGGASSKSQGASGGGSSSSGMTGGSSSREGSSSNGASRKY